MRWTKLTGLEVEFESDITSSTVTYPLPLKKGGQINDSKSGQKDNVKSGQISDDDSRQTTDDLQDEGLNKSIDSGQKNHSESDQKDGDKSGQYADISKGYKTGDKSRSKIVEAMRRNPEISRKELSSLLGISQSAIQRHIEYLKAAQVIVRLGSDRKGLWKVLI